MKYRKLLCVLLALALLLALARELAAYLHCPVAAGELLKEKMICLC